MYELDLRGNPTRVGFDLEAENLSESKSNPARVRV
jgi:hypothetical protein